jgi:hypothetical protein
MRTFDALGTITSSFVCGSSGTCVGSTQATQQAFIALQTQMNRVGGAYGITRVDVDGKLGPRTLTAMMNLAAALGRKLGGNLDPAIEELIIETGTPVTTRDLAINAERLTAALQRGGTGAEAWSVLTSIRDVAQQIIATGAAAPQLPPASAGTPIDPYGSSTVVQPAVATWPNTPANTWAYPPAAAPAPHIILPRPPGWMIAVGVGLVILLIGGGVALARR